MSDNLKRVRDKVTGHEYTTGTYDPEVHEPTGKKATDDFGRPLPAIPNLPAPAEENTDKGTKTVNSVKA